MYYNTNTIFCDQNYSILFTKAKKTFIVLAFTQINDKLYY